MSIYGKSFELIDENDLQDLVINYVQEGRDLDYKVKTYDSNDEGKRELLADVTAFANSSGGFLILGIEEGENGSAKEVVGLNITDIDAEILKLENCIRDGIAPRISNIRIRHIELKNRKPVIIFNIPKSWASPHMVTFKGSSRFFIRDSRGKHQMDFTEIRAAFRLSDTIQERIQKFRSERIEKFENGTSYFGNFAGPKMLLHIIPFNAFDIASKVDLNSPHLTNLMPIIPSGSFSKSFNFDGLIIDIPSRDNTPLTYLQIFRNGIFEIGDMVTISSMEPNKKFIYSENYERKLLESLPRFLKAQKDLGVSTPLVIMLTLIGVKGYHLSVDSKFVFHYLPQKVKEFDRDVLAIPEIIIENLEANQVTYMKPIFDIVWNSGGWQRSMNYNEKGEWRGQSGQPLNI